MDTLLTYLDMGGYAVWVWTAYGLFFAGTIGMLLWSVRTLRAREKEFEALKSARERGPS